MVDTEKESEDDNDITATIQRMQTAGTCCSPVHYHAFRGSARPLLTFRRVVCVACHEPVVWSSDQLLPFSQPTAVQCVACSVVAHRSCAARKSVWNATNRCQTSCPRENSTEEPESAAGDSSDHISVDDGENPDENGLESNDRVSTKTKPESSPTSSEAISSSDDELTPVPPPISDPPTKTAARRVSSYPGLRKQQEASNGGGLTNKPVKVRQPHPAELDPIDTSWEVTVAAIAGGMAGMVIAGPVGAAGGAIAAAAARQQQSQKRSLLLHNGVSVSVRPQIPTDPVWYNYVAQAVRTAPRRPKNAPLHADITAVAESEMDTHDKILLLVHRTLNDTTTSRSGHMYRYLMAIYQDRLMQQQNQQSSSRRRRDDVHAIVRHVTASLVEERPELGAAWIEVTAATVESLVFGQLYESVMQEIVEETCERDVALWRKITCAQQASIDLKAVLEVSPKAIQALQMLPQSHAATEKLHFLVVFLDHVSQHIMDTDGEDCSADSLLKIVCQHVVYLENNICSYAEIAFLEEFSRDEALLRGREGYALVTFQACLEFLQVTEDLKKDVVGIDD